MHEPEGSADKWDAFLSYASEDKKDFVRPLADRLRKEGVNIWFDEFEIDFGDSITQAIEFGLAKSKIGVIVISQASLRKNWTKYEISALKNLYINFSKRIIPIWKDIDADTIRKTDPGLLDIRAISSAGLTIEQVAYKIISVARPDILSRINYKLVEKALRADAEVMEIDPRLLKKSPRRREKIPKRDLSRIRVIHSIFCDVLGDLDGWIDGFCRDGDYEDEILFWEMVGSFYLSWNQERRYSRKDKKIILRTLMELVSRGSVESIDAILNKSPEHVRKPFLGKIDEWNAELQLTRGYLFQEIHDDPGLGGLFADFRVRKRKVK